MPCGVSGFVGLSDRTLLRSMASVQRHRGPDSTGYYLDERVGLATDRLSIIDITGGDQPIHNEDGTVWVTFNGEIYNHIELREELVSLGHRFYTKSDTEVIVHAYEAWGVSSLERLRGMFAFALWDAERRRLFCARDRFGKKPLYYARVGDVLLFSSEMKGLLQYPEIRRRIDRRAMDYFFTYLYIPSPWTILEGVQKLPPGSYLQYDGKDLRVERYWDLRFGAPAGSMKSEDEVVDEIYRLLVESVTMRLRSDVPLGCFLSGGIDSGIIASMMVRASPGATVKTVTMGFDQDDQHMEYGRVAAEYLKTDHREHVLGPGSVDILPKLVWHFDEPFADASFIPTYYVSQEMRKEVKVALTGDGGDELFMGYPFLTDQRLYGAYMAFPRPLRRLGLQVLTRAPGSGETKRMAGHALEKRYDEERDFIGRYVLRMVVFTPDGLKRLYSREAHDTFDHLERHLQKYRERPLDAVSYATIRGYLSEGILTKVDRMSMAASLEARSPLLDHVFAEYAATLDPSLKCRGQTSKYVLKRMATKKSLLPREIITRKKVGFGPPVSRWVGKEWREVMERMAERAASTDLFSAEYVRWILRSSQLHSSKVFALAVFAIWYEQYVAREDTRTPMPLNKMI